ncbi:MAG: sigma factor-like helix-turn-helix DNA-binding protein [Nocardioidaceae bacterium]
MREESFDSFYRATRRRVLHQAFALTGDLPAAQSAVRDAYVGAWQHWRKVSRLDDPLDWVRPRAWQLAQRRHTARIWHRNKGLSEEHKAVLDALSGLPVAQRRVLLLTDLAGLDSAHAARELGVTRDLANANQQRARAGLAMALGVEHEVARDRLLGLDHLLEHATLPRGPIVRRAGRKRRQGHALVGAAAAVATALGAGAFTYQPTVSNAEDLRLVKPEAPVVATPDVAASAPTGGNLLDPDQIRRLGLAQRWNVSGTGDNTSGDGINTVCQQTRFADPDGYSAIVRSFAATGSPRRSAVQTVEVSKTEKQAQAAFGTTVGWFAGCRLGRLQLLSSYAVDNIGDEADVLMVKLWKKPVTTLSVAVARTGKVTTTTVGTTVGAAPPPAQEITQSLADSVAMLCARSGSSDCAKRPTYRVVPPPPSGEERGILAVADLPPVGRISQPWVGTQPAPARVNPSATTCDRADFAKGGATRTRTRTYLIPEASLPARFGLSETYGVFASTRAANRFLSEVRGTVGRCEKRDLATQVSGARTERRTSPRLDLDSWDLQTKVNDQQKVRFRLGFVRVRRTVAQLTFAPSPADDMTATSFHALLVRSGDRLRELD